MNNQPNPSNNNSNSESNNPKPNMPNIEDIDDIDDIAVPDNNNPKAQTAINVETEHISKTDEENLAGKVEESSMPESLVEPDQELGSETERPASQKPTLRLVTVLGGLGIVTVALATIWSGFLAPKPAKQRVVAEAPTPTATPTENNELASTKASLALQDQRQAVKATPPPIAKNPKAVEKRTPQQPRPQQPRTRRPARNVERVATRPAPRVVTRTITVAAKPTPTRQASTAPRPQQIAAKPPIRNNSPNPAKQENPLDRWAALANLGEMEQPQTTPGQTQPNRSKNTAIARFNPTIQPVAATSETDATGNSTYSTVEYSRPNGSSAINPESDRAKSDTRIPTVTIGEEPQASYDGSEEDSPEDNTETQPSPAGLPETLVASASRNPLITTDSDSSTLTQVVETVEEAEATDAPAAPSGEESEITIAGLTSGETGILNQTPSNTSSNAGYKEVPIGTSTKGVTLTTMTLNEASDQDPTFARTAIQLTQDLMASDGTAALPKGTTLIVQAEKGSLSAIAIVYKDAAGNTHQQQIPSGAITIKGTNNSPLIAQSSSGNRPIISKQDVLLGALSGLGNIGQVINRPRSQTTINSSVLGSNQTTISTANNPNILAAALEGVFNTTVRRATEKAAQADIQPTQPRNVSVIAKGTEVTVFVNAFLRVAK